MGRWRWILRREEPPAPHQQVFGFVRRTRRRWRAFRVAIIAATALAIAAIIASSPIGRLGVVMAAHRVRWAVLAVVGLPPPREEIEAERHRQRLIGVDRTRAALAQEIALHDPTFRNLFESTRMDPESAVIRWGNYSGTLVLSSGVFEPDDTGRSYRFRPETRSVWFIGLSIRGAMCQFQIPDTPEARAGCAAAGGRLVPGSVQTTSSWGCRGPEPDTSAPLRGIVLGDSVMQGVLVGDDQTPPACLEREMARRTGLRTSVLNGGVLGYSTEQYYYTLQQFIGRMSPHFVIVSLCGNDFLWDSRKGWEEPCYWLEKILELCRRKQITCLVVAWPGEDSLLATRDDSIYPGQVSHLLKLAGTHYLYPVEAFTNEDLRVRIEREAEGKSVGSSPLYNRHLMGDNHLSPLGCAFWGRQVAERLHLIFQRHGLLPPVNRSDRPARHSPPS